MLRVRCISLLFGSLSIVGKHFLCNSSHRTRILYQLFNRTMSYKVNQSGAPNSMDYRMYFSSEDGHALSPFHDIPLYANEEQTILNMVVEVPRWSTAKMEINTKEALNPIKQDVKKGKLRYVKNCFPYTGYIWNYGALPQTWEDPSHKDDSTGAKGDNDPVDVCDISTTVSKRGEVKQVKVLGVLAMIDEGETDWKVIAIDVNDTLAKDMNDVDDIEKHMPGLLKATVDWFRIYKVPTGKPFNEFAFNGTCKNKEFAMKVINETHMFWKDLISNKSENTNGLACKTVSVENSPYKISQEDADSIIKNAAPLGDANPIDDETRQWHFVKRS